MRVKVARGGVPGVETAGMYDLNQLFDAIGLEAIYHLDAPRRVLARQLMGREEFAKTPQLVAALPVRIVAMFRAGIMEPKGARLPIPTNPPRVTFH